MTNPSENYKTPDGETPKDENIFPGDIDNEVFRLTEDGVYLVNPQKGNTVEISTRICDWLKVEADTVDEEGEQNGEGKEDEQGKEEGICIRFMTSRGTKCKMNLQKNLVAKTGNALIENLSAYGLNVYPEGYAPKYGLTRLNRYIKAVIARGNLPLMKAIPRAGWVDETFSSFLFKNGCISINDTCPFILKEDAPGMAIKSKGILKEWKDGINRLAAKSTRIRFAVAVSLAAPLVPILTSGHNVLFHFFGSSGRGKTTTLKAAWSVWGNEIPTMKATKNGLEEMFAASNHILFVGDELKQLSSAGLADLAFTYSEGGGSTRSDRGIKARKRKKWRGLGLTAAEQSLREIKREKAKNRSPLTLEGEIVRFINIPAMSAAMAGKCGVFEGYPSELMLEEDGGTYSHVDGEKLNSEGIPDALDKAQQEYVGKASEFLSNEAYGTAGKAFIERVEKDIAKNGLKAFKEEAAEFVSLFKEETPSGGHSLTRVMETFALVAYAGEKAIEYGVLPWEEGSLKEDVQSIFEAWKSSGETPEQQAAADIDKLYSDAEESDSYDRFMWNGSKFDLDEHRGTEIAGKIIKNEGGILCIIYTPGQLTGVLQKVEAATKPAELTRELVRRNGLLRPNKTDRYHYGQCQVNKFIPEIEIGNDKKRMWYFILLTDVNPGAEEGDAARADIVKQVEMALGMRQKGAAE